MSDHPSKAHQPHVIMPSTPPGSIVMIGRSWIVAIAPVIAADATDTPAGAVRLPAERRAA
jgi:hypothetical protein